MSIPGFRNLSGCTAYSEGMHQLTPSVTLLVALVLATGTAWGQSTSAPAFDVASIRPAAPLQQQIASRQLRVGATITDARADLRSVSLAELVAMAYRIKPFQLSGPEWIKAERYDLQATLPPGTNKDQVPEMLQTLLAERFHLKIRREDREHSVYALVQGSDGHKLTASAPPAAQPAAPPEGARTLDLGGQQLHITGDNRSMAATGPDGASVRATQSSDGAMQMMLGNMTLGRLAETLTTFVDRPVVDQTGLEGGYDIPLQLRQEDVMAAVRNAAQQAGVAVPVLPGAPAAGQAADPAGSSIFASVRQLGLRLEPRRLPLETIVVESADKVPIAN
jgi:uncharacterized protein (TIGR03435 family)